MRAHAPEQAVELRIRTQRVISRKHFRHDIGRTLILEPANGCLSQVVSDRSGCFQFVAFLILILILMRLESVVFGLSLMIANPHEPRLVGAFSAIALFTLYVHAVFTTEAVDGQPRRI